MLRIPLLLGINKDIGFDENIIVRYIQRLLNLNNIGSQVVNTGKTITSIY